MVQRRQRQGGSPARSGSGRRFSLSTSGRLRSTAGVSRLNGPAQGYAFVRFRTRESATSGARAAVTSMVAGLGGGGGLWLEGGGDTIFWRPGLQIHSEISPTELMCGRIATYPTIEPSSVVIFGFISNAFARHDGRQLMQEICNRRRCSAMPAEKTCSSNGDRDTCNHRAFIEGASSSSAAASL